MRPGLLEQRGHLEIGGDVFLAGRRVHDDERVGLGRPGGRVDIAARHAEIAAEAGVSGCHADSADAPSEVACQPGTDEGESRVVLEHSYKYSAQHGARDFDQRPLTAGLGAYLLLASMGAAPADEPTAPNPRRPQRRPPKPGHGRTNPVDEPVTIEADDKDFDFDVNGNARVIRQRRDAPGRQASSAPIASSTTRRPSSAKLTGGVEFTDPVLKVRGNSGTYSPALGARIRGQRSSSCPQRNARGAARNMQVDANGKMTLRGRVASPPARPRIGPGRCSARRHRARHARADGTGRGTSVEFKGVPIMYLPWMTFPDRRRSARAASCSRSIGGSSRNGAEIEVPYYWNIRPNLDFTARARLLLASAAWISPASCAISRTASAARSTSTICPSDDIAGIDRTRFTSSTSPSCPATGASASTPPTSATPTTSRTSRTGPEGTSVPFAERLAEVTYRDEHLNVRAQVQDFQTIDDELPDGGPAVRAHAARARLGRLGPGPGAIDYGFDAEFVNFERNIGVTGWRMDVAPRVGLDWSAPGYFVRPSAGYRYTQYSLKDQAPGTDDSPTRSLPFASLDAGLVFERAPARTASGA